MTRILNYFWRAWFVLLAIIITPILGIPVLLLSINPNHFKYAYVFIRLWCIIMFYGMGFRYELINKSGKKIDKDKDYVIIANHYSTIDVFLPSLLHPNHPLIYVGKKELDKIPIFATIYKRICVLVDRNDPKSRASVYDRCAERMQQGNNIVIFPEGGVPDDTSIMLLPFKDGAFRLAEEHQFPIAVYTYLGLKEMFPFDNGKGFPGKVTVILNDILEPNESAEILKEKSRNLILETLENYYAQRNK